MTDPEVITPELVSTQALAVRPTSALPTVQDLEQQFELAVRQRELLSQYIKKQLVPGKHFYQRGTQKPSLAKEGAEIILLPHNLAPDYEQIGGPDSPPADGRPYQITVKCVLRRKGDLSSFVGSGIGSAGSEKQKRDGTYIHRQEDKYLCHNATLKMAQKSAMIAATINSTAASEFFTQDMDEPGQSEPEPQHPHKPEPPPKSAASKVAERAAHFPTEKFRSKMISELKAGPGEPNREIVTEYFTKLENPSQLMPGEELESLPLRFVPATKEQMLALHSKIMGFSSGEPAAPAFPPHPEPEDTKPSPKPKAAEPEDDLPMGDDRPALRGKIETVSLKEGKSKKGPWSLWGIKIEGVWVNSFSNTIGQAAREAKEVKHEVTLFYEMDGDRMKATELVLADGTSVKSE